MCVVCGDGCVSEGVRACVRVPISVMTLVFG